MRRLLTGATLFFCSLLTGCSLLEHYLHRRPERAPPEEAAKVVFPNSFEQGIRLDGPAMVAIEAAMSEFLPPGAQAEARDERLARCLSRRDTYDVTVLKASDDLYFVDIFPNLSRCGIELAVPIMDAGATYAIDGRGRILSEL
jgi:hypothetical protein